MKVLNVFFLLLFLAVMAAAVFFVMPVYLRNNELKLEIADMEKSLAAQRLEIARLRAEKDALSKDNEAIERIARERFGLCREGETIYWFDDASGKGDDRSASGKTGKLPPR